MFITKKTVFHLRVCFFQTFRLCFKPLGLQEHQLRPQDVGEKTLADIGAGPASAKYAGGEPYTMQQTNPHYPVILPKL